MMACRKIVENAVEAKILHTRINPLFVHKLSEIKLMMFRNSATRLYKLENDFHVKSRLNIQQTFKKDNIFYKFTD